MNAIRKIAVAILALIVTLAGGALIISPLLLAHPTRLAASGALARSSARGPVFPGLRNSRV